MSIISDKHKFCFININRIGGGTINTLLKKQVEDIQYSTPPICTVEHTNNLFPKISDYHKFSFVRCPYDWLVSIYYHITNHEMHTDHLFVRGLNFHDFIKWLDKFGMKRKESDLQPIYKTQTDFLFIDDTLVVDKIYKFEGLSNDAGTSNILHLFLNLNLLMPNNIPMINRSERPLGWDSLYDYETYKLVNRIFEEDFKNFNYKMYEY